MEHSIGGQERSKSRERKANVFRAGGNSMRSRKDRFSHIFDQETCHAGASFLKLLPGPLSPKNVSVMARTLSNGSMLSMLSVMP